jgi:hypothetical protein
MLLAFYGSAAVLMPLTFQGLPGEDNVTLSREHILTIFGILGAAGASVVFLTTLSGRYCAPLKTRGLVGLLFAVVATVPVVILCGGAIFTAIDAGIVGIIVIVLGCILGIASISLVTSLLLYIHLNFRLVTPNGCKFRTIFHELHTAARQEGNPIDPVVWRQMLQRPKMILVAVLLLTAICVYISSGRIALVVAGYFGFEPAGRSLFLDAFYVQYGDSSVPENSELVYGSLIASLVVLSIVLLRCAHTILRRELRLLQASANTALLRDRRRPVLLLRSFEDDLAQLSPRSMLRKFQNRKRRLEESLNDFAGRLGPFVALGQPGEVLPNLGAYRDYPSDDSWQDLVRKWMSSSQMIVMIAGVTKWFEWELVELDKEGSLLKTAIFFPPGSEAKRRNRLAVVQGSLRGTRWAAAVTQLSQQSLLGIAFLDDGRLLAIKGKETDEVEFQLAACILMFQVLWNEVAKGTLFSDGSHEISSLDEFRANRAMLCCYVKHGNWRRPVPSQRFEPPR